MRTFTFRDDVAMAVGVNAAILFENISWWVEKNEKNGTNCHEGRFWTYNSVKAFAELFPFLTQSAIRAALRKLIDDGFLVEGVFNKTPYDRTKWYSIGEKGLEFCNVSNLQDENFDLSKNENRNFEDEKPIPVSKPDVKPFINHEREGGASAAQEKRKRFSPPTRDEVADYCEERRNGIDPDRFIAYYESNGWKVGRNPMKDWRAAVRTWEKRDAGNVTKKPDKGRKITIEELMRIPIIDGREHAEEILSANDARSYARYWVNHEWGQYVDGEVE